MLTRRSLFKAGAGLTMLFGGVMGLVGCKGGGSLDPSLIRAVRLTSGGGMTGGYSSTELVREKDGTVTLVTTEKQWHNERARYVTYAVEAEAFVELARICDEYDLRAASKRKRSDLVVMDGPTSTLRFELVDEQGVYDPEASFSVSSEQKLNASDREGWQAVAQALAELAGSHEGVESVEPVRFTLVADGAQYQFVANDCAAVDDLASRTPLDIVFEDLSEGRKGFRLDQALDVTDCPAASGAAGTLCYDTESGYVVFLCTDDPAADGLYELGRVDSEFQIAFIAEMEPGAYSLWSNG